jgi:hypothetical protein
MMFAAITANNVQKSMGSPICSLRLALFFESFRQALYLSAESGPLVKLPLTSFGSRGALRSSALARPRSTTGRHESDLGLAGIPAVARLTRSRTGTGRWEKLRAPGRGPAW